MENPFSWQHGASPSERKVSWRGGEGGRRGAEAVLGADSRAPSTGRAPARTTECCCSTQPRRLPREQPLLTDFVLFFVCFTAFLTRAWKLGVGPSPACRVLCQRLTARETWLRREGTPTISSASPNVRQCLKLPEPPEATAGKEKPSGQKWQRMKKRCPCGVGAPPQLPVKVGNQKKDVNPKCEEKNYKISGF